MSAGDSALPETLPPPPSPEAVAREALAVALLAVLAACANPAALPLRSKAKRALTDAGTARLRWESTLWADDSATEWARCLKMARDIETAAEVLDEAPEVIPTTGVEVCDA